MSPSEHLDEVAVARLVRPSGSAALSWTSLAAFLLLDLAFTGDASGRLYLSALLLLTIVALLLNLRWYRVTLTASEAVVRGLRVRRIAWRDVQAVTKQRSRTGRRLVIWTSIS